MAHRRTSLKHYMRFKGKTQVLVENYRILSSQSIALPYYRMFHFSPNQRAIIAPRNIRGLNK
ncbi:MAG: hypothetical protein WBQ25_26635, partial [Nitrososphaeraceae archaeon]